MNTSLSFKRRLKNVIPPRVQKRLLKYKKKLWPVRTNPVVVASGSANERLLPCVIAYNEFGGYCVPRSSLHRPVAQAVIKGKIWEERTLRFIATRAEGGDIVHAGTYYGDFLPALASFCVDDAKVWAFEPSAENFRCAEITILINGLENVHLVHAGVGETEGEAMLVASTRSGESLGGLARIAGGSKADRALATQSTRIVTIDGTVPASRSVSVIQLDVEGFEQKALAGALATIDRCRPTLILESVPDKAWLDRHIFSRGYAVSGRFDENTAFICAEPAR